MIVHGVFIVFWQFNADFVLRQTFEKTIQDACGNVELNPHIVWITMTEVVLVHLSVSTVKRSSDFFRGKTKDDFIIIVVDTTRIVSFLLNNKRAAKICHRWKNIN